MFALSYLTTNNRIEVITTFFVPGFLLAHILFCSMIFECDSKSENFYLFSLKGCGGELEVSRYGQVNSPGYPNNPPNPNLDCTWNMKVPQNDLIEIGVSGKI